MLLIIESCDDDLKFLYGEFVRPIIQVLENLNLEYDKDFEVVNFKNLKDINFKKYDKIIICGTSLKDDKFLKYDYPKELLEKKLFGICAGAQIIAKLYDEKIIINSEVGNFDYKKVEEDKILEDTKISKVYLIHNLSSKFDKENYKIILKTENGPILVKRKNKSHYCSIFHPEVNNEKVLDNFINLV